MPASLDRLPIKVQANGFALQSKMAIQGQKQGFLAAGHSLGGAVALLCTLRLLQGLAGSTPSLQCICFGTPAIGNAALAAVVAEYGWESHILNFVLPGARFIALRDRHSCKLHLQNTELPPKGLWLCLCPVALDMHDNECD